MRIRAIITVIGKKMRHVNQKQLALAFLAQTLLPKKFRSQSDEDGKSNFYQLRQQIWFYFSLDDVFTYF